MTLREMYFKPKQKQNLLSGDRPRFLFFSTLVFLKLIKLVLYSFK